MCYYLVGIVRNIFISCMLASNHEVISCYSADNHISVLDSMNETEFQILFQLSKFVSIQHFFVSNSTNLCSIEQRSSSWSIVPNGRLTN